MTRVSTRLLLLICFAWLTPAQAQVRHCVAPDGTQIFTDRKCEELGARKSEPPASTSTNNAAGARYSRRNVCPSSVQDLAYALEKAVQARDANQIAALYDWAGMSTSSAYRVMAQLQQTASRPLVRVRIAESSGTSEDESDAPSSMRITGLRVEQTLANGITPASAFFGLRRRLGCWWLHL